MRFSHLGAVVVCLFAAGAQAQTLSGVVRDSATGSPIAGAVIIQLDANRMGAVRTSTNGQGAYSTK